MSDRFSDYKSSIDSAAGISLADGKTVYIHSDSRKATATSSVYLDRLDDLPEDADTDTAGVAPPVASPKADRPPMSKKDKTVITVLAALNLAVFAFIGIFLMLNDGGDAYKTVKANASFNPTTDYFNTAGIFSELNAYVKGVEFPAGIRNEYKFLYSENSDTVGWLRIKDTSIDGVVVKGTSNSEYERADFYKQSDQRTRIYFMDFRNTIGYTADGFSKNTIIYGHHLTEDECIFADVEKYMDVAYYKTHPVIEMNTLYADYQWKVFACMVTNVDSEDDNGNRFYYWNPYITDDETVAFANEILTRSWFINPAVDIRPTDKFLMLSTCTYILNRNGFVNARCVLCARLVRTGEPETVDVSGAYQNENKRMPQIYYTLAGIQNPFASVPVFKSVVE